MTRLLEAQELVVQFAGSGSPAVANVSVEIDDRSAIGIVGESGSGKTTLARALVGALVPTAGQIRINGKPWNSVKRTDAARRMVQMIFQDPYEALNPYQTARNTIAEVLRNWHAMGRQQASERAGELLREVGLTENVLDRLPSRLSGGQCQRVGIARALACDPAVLVADEPTSSLDASVQGQILNLLLNLRESRGLALVLISHDLAVVRHVTEHVLVMYRGHVVERGTTADIFAAPVHPYTKILIDSMPGQEGSNHMVENEAPDAGGCVFASRCSQMHAACITSVPAPVWLSRQHAVACVLARVDPAPSQGDVQSLERNHDERSS